jgi:transcription elongation factor Elf1
MLLCFEQCTTVLMLLHIGLACALSVLFFLCSTNINYLTEPIDIFTEWIDEAEATNAANGHDDDLDDLDA